MEQRVEQKINEIQDYLDEFGTIMPASFEEYNSDLLKKVACERYFEKILFASESLAMTVLRKKQLAFPESESAAYLVLSENMIIESELGQRLSELEQMRKIIINPDEFIEDAELYALINEKLISSVSELLEAIKIVE